MYVQYRIKNSQKMNTEKIMAIAFLVLLCLFELYTYTVPQVCRQRGVEIKGLLLYKFKCVLL